MKLFKKSGETALAIDIGMIMIRRTINAIIFLSLSIFSIVSS